ncbi:alpha/beta hydrolase [Roseomonas sp. GC11]|uniref:alpha/beta hydrolase n=1 Tax=Roseomonas sp. GC11 TaxID=2950546 RepID=UPI00210C2834|nr:alpha/beta hydrolase [Roseomonas sp. GC11]MCQ4162464.1 alpha/beta hydrolase [Roseomonas sp. GC11]
MTSPEQTGRLDRGDGTELAWARLPGRGPTVVFLGGFRSDMEGSKALALRDACAARGQAFLRFDYSGHGISGGAFEEGGIGIWARDAATLIGRLVEGPMLLAGSSMGGWIALLMLREFGARVVGLIGIAAAPDFTKRLMWPSFSPEQQRTIREEGVLLVESPYGPPVPITRHLIEDGAKNLVLEEAISFSGPVRLLQGMQDREVPWQTATDLAQAITGADIRILLVKDGDHRLSREEDLALLVRTLDDILEKKAGGAAP